MHALAASQTTRDAERALQSFLSQYRGMKVVVLPFKTNPSMTLSWDNLNSGDLPALIAYGKLFICEWAKYSQRWVNGSRIRLVALVKNLAKLTTGPCRVSGLTDWRDSTFYQDVLCGAEGGSVKQKHTMHHEFWHLTAPNSFGGDPNYEDGGWLALNDPGFSYGHSGWDPTAGWNATVIAKHPRPGFVSAYAMHNEYEDEAETYAFMFVKEEHRELVDFITTDPILKGKVEHLKQRIGAIDPAINDSYLERAAQ